jgi:hypothetical protein
MVSLFRGCRILVSTACRILPTQFDCPRAGCSAFLASLQSCSPAVTAQPSRLPAKKLLTQEPLRGRLLWCCPLFEVSQFVVTLRPVTYTPFSHAQSAQRMSRGSHRQEGPRTTSEFGMRRDQLDTGVKQARCHERRARRGTKENLLEARLFPEKSRELFYAPSGCDRCAQRA